MQYDVAVIGAGVVGSAIARELSRYDLRCVLVEAKADVGAGTSKANTAIWHTGFDAKPGTLECRLLRHGYALLEEFIPEAGIPVERLGAVLVAWTEEQKQQLPAIVERAHQNGVTDVCQLDANDVYEREPALAPGALGGIHVPREGILCTFTIPLALAKQAVLNGVTLKLNHPVVAIDTDNGAYVLRGPGGDVRCRYLVNAAGLHSDDINRMLGHDEFTVTPRRGELIVFDKLSRSLVDHVLLPVPTARTKGVLISPTVYGNVMLGPTAEDLRDKRQTSTSADGLAYLRQQGEALMPRLMQEEVTAAYAGLRAATEHADYQIHAHPDQRYVCVGGIRSTGVSASLGIAEYVVGLLEDADLSLVPKAEFVPVHMPPIGEVQQRPYQSDEMIAVDSAYGQIVCYCERVTAGEIAAAAADVIPARTIDGLRRRTRALQGRCQGFNCHANVLSMFADASGQSAARLMGMETHA